MNKTIEQWYVSLLAKDPWYLFPLTCCSFLFRIATSLRRCFLRWEAKRRSPLVPIITVGNISVGGTGKTPFIMLLLDHLSDLRIGYVSRGYRRKKKGLYVATGHVNPSQSGDEAALIAKTYPHVRISVCENKWKAIQAIQHDVDLIILDDGLQRYDIPCALWIAMVDAKCPDGYGRLLPRGLLREPWSRLQNVDAIVLTNGTADEITSLPFAAIETKGDITALHSSDGTIQSIPQSPVALFSAIANPDRFLHSMQRLGAMVVDHLIFQDHGEISDKSLKEYFDRLQKRYPNITLVGTEKDWARKETWPQLPLLFAKFTLCISKGEPLFNELLQETRRVIDQYTAKRANGEPYGR